MDCAYHALVGYPGHATFDANAPLDALDGRTAAGALDEAWSVLVPEAPLRARWDDGSETTLILTAPRTPESPVCLLRGWAGLRIRGLGPTRLQSEDGRVDLELDTALFLSPGAGEPVRLWLTHDAPAQDAAVLGPAAESLVPEDIARPVVVDAQLQLARKGALVRVTAFIEGAMRSLVCLGVADQQAGTTADELCGAP